MNAKFIVSQQIPDRLLQNEENADRHERQCERQCAQSQERKYCLAPYLVFFQQSCNAGLQVKDNSCRS